MPEILLFLTSGASLTTLLVVARLALRAGEYMERINRHEVTISDHEDRMRYLEGTHVVGNRMAENRL